MSILVTGGAGYIGSHAVVELLLNDLDVIVIDDLSNGSSESLERASTLAGKKVTFIQGSILEPGLLDKVFSSHKIEAVLHFAGLKAVGESTLLPLEYYVTNVSGTLNLCQAMARANIYRIVFSSSATVYGEPAEIPLSETSPATEPTSPYGWSKLIAERILSDVSQSDENWAIGALRYFNPVGAHVSGTLGEDPRGVPNNLMPYITKVAAGKLKYLSIYGDDYDTPDGTGVRDYIHVTDVARAHLAALKHVMLHKGHNVWNLGTGVGYSVKNMIATFERVTGNRIPTAIVARRPGDIAECWADASKALRELGWKAEFGLEDMVRDAWRWQSNNPDGYQRI